MDVSVESRSLQNERNHISFSVTEMTNLLDGGKDKTAMRQHIEKVILNDPNMNTIDISFMSPEEQQVFGVKRMIYFYSYLAKKMQWDFSDVRSPELEFLPRSVGLATSLMIHACAFIPCVSSLGTKEQVDKWLPLSKDYFILGCYAQTELGHGTNLRALETTATYDVVSHEFILHSPSISSIKWWPGDLGKTANHALVMAQLFTQGTSCGMHGFIVQIRDLTTHLPMPGISVGSIGAILGSSGITDNGFLKLDCVRVPRENMLAKYSEVLPDGTYMKKGNEKIMYASMINLRVLMTKDEAVLALQKACTIAARYSCVRRQGSLEPGKPEVPIIDYVTQQHKILPQVAAAYAFQFTIKRVMQVYNTFLSDLDQGHVKGLSEIHFLTSGMKASLCEQSAEGVEIVRRACGGHGYSHASGVPLLLCRAIASCTYEGENTVMYLQCANYLIKCASKIYLGQPVEGSVKYLSEPVEPNCEASSVDEFFSLGMLLRCFTHRSQSMLMETASTMQRLVADGSSKMQAWNVTSIDLVDTAKAHMVRYVFSCFMDFCKHASCSDSARNVLKRLCALYGLHQISENTRNFMKDGYLNGAQCKLVQTAEVKLLGLLRKDTIGIVDAFDFRDEILLSCIGSYDGNVYQRLYDHAKSLPINQPMVHSQLHSLLKDQLHIGRDKLNQMKKSSKL